MFPENAPHPTSNHFSDGTLGGAHAISCLSSVKQNVIDDVECGFIRNQKNAAERVRTMRFLRRAGIRRRHIPDRFEVRGKNAERSWISNGCGRRRIMHGDLASISAALASALFQLTRHQTVRRVSGIVLPEDPVGGIARDLEVATKSIAHLNPAVPRLPWR
ncbi:hypothetical protein [Bradyrhizobium sp. SSUT77]|uniref:hypothetical protein n=1 Tax=Bradyrhizobium sp. SSUT77 TaxID=3040603 RepID=UPI002449CAF1|nr:hypothetical protein [Bradyrhizobium sp. SSUT77]MDH2348861.1 hypothetical protein [Bradyrhizobium sp. SSUT77]